ncbi:hypothetical protein [Candidatus Uabimicrobium sp. HlEnr_7]|uniref:hypothetical protein n=1 Tax=Candidatus Uabimicrobium helgolandensis TaxID=3095367 RepID=UPI003557EBDB
MFNKIFLPLIAVMSIIFFCSCSYFALYYKAYCDVVKEIPPSIDEKIEYKQLTFSKDHLLVIKFLYKYNIKSEKNYQFSSVIWCLKPFGSIYSSVSRSSLSSSQESIPLLEHIFTKSEDID